MLKIKSPARRPRGHDFRPARRACQVAAALLFVSAMAWQHVQATHLGYQLDKARQRLLVLRCAQGTLQSEIESILSPANLSAQARGRMGMSLADLDSLRVLAKSPLDKSSSGILRRLLTRARRALSATFDV